MTGGRTRRSHVYPDGLWGMQIDVPYPKAIRCGEMVFTCGQCDLDGQGRPQRPGDLLSQTARTIGYAYQVVAEAGATPADMARFQVFYVSDGSVDEEAYLAHIAEAVRAAGGSGAHPVITLTPIPNFYYPGMMVEIDAQAMIGHAARPRVEAPSRPAWLPAPFAPALRAGDMIHVGAIEAREADGEGRASDDAAAQMEVALDELTEALGVLGAELSDVVKLNTYYLNEGGNWNAMAEVRARRFLSPGPVITDVPLPTLWPEGATIRIEAIAMRGPDGERVKRRHIAPPGHWNWATQQPFSQAILCKDKLFVGGQLPLDGRGKPIAPDGVEIQTQAAMDSLGALLHAAGMNFRHVVKANTYYRGGPTPEELHRNMEVRNRYYTKPGPASTGIGLPHLGIDGVTVAIEAFAMSD